MKLQLHVQGEWLVLHNVHFYTRQAARETKAARKALTEAARQRHAEMADQYVRRIEQLESRCPAT